MNLFVYLASVYRYGKNYDDKIIIRDKSDATQVVVSWDGDEYIAQVSAYMPVWATLSEKMFFTKADDLKWEFKDIFGSIGKVSIEYPNSISISSSARNSMIYFPIEDENDDRRLKYIDLRILSFLSQYNEYAHSCGFSFRVPERR